MAITFDGLKLRAPAELKGRERNTWFTAPRPSFVGFEVTEEELTDFATAWLAGLKEKKLVRLKVLQAEHQAACDRCNLALSELNNYRRQNPDL